MRSKKLTYPKWSVAQLRSVRLPASLSDSKTESALVKVYDKWCNEPLQRWADADADPMRLRIDRAAAAAYGLDEAKIADWRERLAREPTIANRMASE